MAKKVGDRRREAWGLVSALVSAPRVASSDVRNSAWILYGTVTPVRRLVWTSNPVTTEITTVHCTYFRWALRSCQANAQQKMAAAMALQEREHSLVEGGTQKMEEDGFGSQLLASPLRTDTSEWIVLP